jgi:hypothetical protein
MAEKIRAEKAEKDRLAAEAAAAAAATALARTQAAAAAAAAAADTVAAAMQDAAAETESDTGTDEPDTRELTLEEEENMREQTYKDDLEALQKEMLTAPYGGLCCSMLRLEL